MRGMELCQKFFLSVAVIAAADIGWLVPGTYFSVEARILFDLLS
jgi:hypothetical protein